MSIIGSGFFVVNAKFLKTDPYVLTRAGSFMADIDGNFRYRRVLSAGLCFGRNGVKNEETKDLLSSSYGECRLHRPQTDNKLNLARISAEADLVTVYSIQFLILLASSIFDDQLVRAHASTLGMRHLI